MEYKYNLAKLQYDKEKMEELITRHNRRIGQVFPQKLEQEFWRLNLERARRNINDFLWSGVLAYFIFAILTIQGIIGLLSSLILNKILFIACWAC